MATIKEIAQIVGVSSAAVSRVLNYDEGISVSADTRAAIFAAAEQVGYKKRVRRLTMWRYCILRRRKMSWKTFSTVTSKRNLQNRQNR